MFDTYKSADFAKTHSGNRSKCVVRSVYPSLHTNRLWCVEISYGEDGHAVSAVGKLSKKSNIE